MSFILNWDPDTDGGFASPEQPLLVLVSRVELMGGVSIDAGGD